MQGHTHLLTVVATLDLATPSSAKMLAGNCIREETTLGTEAPSGMSLRCHARPLPTGTRPIAGSGASADVGAPKAPVPEGRLG